MISFGGNMIAIEDEEIKSIADAVKRTYYPEERICKRCNHNACKYCQDWCDILANDEQEVKEYGVHIIERLKDGVTGEQVDFPVLCCGGSCEY